MNRSTPWVTRALRFAPYAVAGLLLADPAGAQSSDEAKAQAVQLFDEAERLVASGKYADACPKYAESNRLDPQLGVLMYLADCYEKNGQLASAWGSFRSASEIAEQRGDARATVARTRAQALAGRVSRLVIEVPEAARVPGLVVKRDGQIVSPSVFGSAIAVDAGEHRVEAEAPGYTPWSGSASVSGEGTETKLVMEPLTRLPPQPAAPGGPASPGVDKVSEKKAESGSGQRIAAIGLGGLGLVGVGIGGFFGLSAQSAASDSNPLCNAKNVCTQEGDELRERAKSRALVATIATVAGGAALAGAAVLWFTAPSSDATTVGAPAARTRVGLAFSPAGAFVSVRGSLD